MARIPQFQEQKITVRPQDPLAGAEGENIANVGKLLIQAGDIFQQRKLARDMTKVNELATDFELQLQDDYLQMQRDRASNPEEFAKDFNTHIQTRKKEFLEKADLGASGRQAFQTIAESQRGNFGTKALQFENKQEVLNFADSVERTAEKNNLLAYRMGQDLDIKSLPEIDNKIQANVLAGASFVPREQLEKMRTVQTQNAYNEWFTGHIEEAPERALQLLDSKKYDEKLGVDNLQSLRASALRNIKILEKGREEAQGKFLELARMTDALQGKILLDPKTKDDVKTVDTYWEFLSDEHNANNLGFDERIQDAKIISEKAGIIPSQVQTTLSAMLFNGDTSQQAMASQFIADITTDRPRVAEQFDSDTRAFAESVNINLDAGVDQQRAVEWTRNSIDINKKQERSLRHDSYNKGKENIKAVQKDIEKFESRLRPFFGDIRVDENIISDFANLQESYYMNENVDRKTAYKLAEKDILNLYAVTDIGEKRYMKYAPERFYGEKVEENYGAKPDWIKKQVINKVFETEDKLFETEKQRKEYINRISLEVNPDSIVGGQNPTYYIFEENEFGGVDIIRDNNNQPIDYIPNFQETEEFKEIQKQLKNTETKEEIQENIRMMRQERRFKDKTKERMSIRGIFGFG